MIRYLLGAASEPEQRQLEEQYFADDGAFEELLAVEDDLIDACVRGELSPQEREQFNQHFLMAPEQSERIGFARALLTRLARTTAGPTPLAAPQEREPWWRSWLSLPVAQQPALRLSLAAGLLVLALAGSWLILEHLRLRHRLEQAEAERAALRQEEQSLRRQVEEHRARGAQLREELERERNARRTREQVPTAPQPPQTSFASFILTPGLVRDLDEAERLVIPPGTDWLRLYLELEDDERQSYRAVLRAAGGEEVWSQGGLKARPIRNGRALVLRVPARLLDRGDYLLKLQGLTAAGNLEDVDDYSFRVEKR